MWDVAEKVQVAEHHGHKFGVSCVVCKVCSFIPYSHFESPACGLWERTSGLTPDCLSVVISVKSGSCDKTKRTDVSNFMKLHM